MNEVSNLHLQMSDFENRDGVIFSSLSEPVLKMPRPLLSDLRLIGSLWKLKKTVYYEQDQDGIRRFKSDKIVSRILFDQVLHQYISRAKRPREFLDQFYLEASKNIYFDKKDMWELKNKLGLLISLLDDRIPAKVNLHKEYHQFFDLSPRRYVPIQELVQVVGNLLSTFQAVSSPEDRDIANQIFYPWKVQKWIKITPYATYCNLNDFTTFDNRPILRQKLENKLARLSDDFVDVEIIDDEKKCREATLSRILSLVDLSQFANCGIKHTISLGEGGMKQALLLRPRLHGQMVSPNSSNASVSSQNSRDDYIEKIYLIGIGIIHAMIHIQGGGFETVCSITNAFGQKLFKCFDLYKSLVPAKLIDKAISPNEVGPSLEGKIPDPSQIVTLQSFVWMTRYFDLQIPLKLVSILQSEKMKEFSHSGVLRQFFFPGDPILSEPELFNNLEIQFNERTLKLHTLAISSKRLTLKRIFDALYPNEMLFLKQAIKINSNIYPSIIPKEILKAGARKLSLLELDQLRSALRKLKQGSSISSPLYRKLN